MNIPTDTKQHHRSGRGSIDTSAMRQQANIANASTSSRPSIGVPSKGVAMFK